MAAKKPPTSRALMEQAIEVMRQSVREARTDGKASPLVGAVLLWPDGSTETACRGELRDGDHAEFTLLERKNRNGRLDGCKLFATLEPCAEGSRKFPKRSCAERIVDARIKEVWVGVEDPDPKVDRKGIKYLQDNGVTVHMFDRDLQEIIRSENAEFLKQALERKAEEADKSPADVDLSPLDAAVPNIELRDLSPEAIAEYRKRVGASSLPDAEFYASLVRQGILERHDDGSLHPTGFGLLLFGRSPRESFPQAGLLATIRHPDGREDVREFDGPLVLIPEEVERWLEGSLSGVIDRSRMRRRRILDVPSEWIREGIVNALVHRDYDIHQAKVQLVVTPESIMIRSPGKPVRPITIEQLQQFRAPMLSRNPRLHYVFAKMDLAEERGLGMQTFREVPPDDGLRRPQYTFDDPYLTLTFFRTADAATSDSLRGLLGELSEQERRGWAFLADRDRTTRLEYEEHLGLDTRTAQRQLKRFRDLGLIRAEGRARGIKYVPNR